MTATDPPPLPRRQARSTAAAARSAASGFGALRPRDDALRDLPLDAIKPNPEQPRRRFDPDALHALAGSIAARGLLQPVVVRPHGPGRFQLIAGERRWRAARLAGLPTVPALIRDADDGVALELALIENLARQDLSPIEEARSLRALIDDLAVPQRELASRLGRSRTDLTHTLRLLELPDPVLDLIDEGALTKGHGKALLAEPADLRRIELADEAAAEGWSVRRLAGAIAAPPTPARSPARSAGTDDAHELTRRMHGQTIAAKATVRATRKGFVICLEATDREQADAILSRLTDPNQ